MSQFEKGIFNEGHLPRPKFVRGDNHAKTPNTAAMTNITREEIDAKLQLIEERLDRKVSDIATAISDLKTSNQQTVNALSNAKWWAIGTAIAVLAIFLSTVQWGLSAQKEENARFSSYIREDVKGIADDVKDISKSVTEMRIKLESKSSEQPK
ncbi:MULTISPECIES: hypothetical protein [unclassified Pseudomonas]|uniref:hypothetical protein n=1 Tax=unclassified Pseudomonas TaxID=196821 RepID=UPI000CD0BA82|nr:MULTISPECIES: hypothetical protein [unclassified Pseudomonas]POA26359.1 hypothetical protein C1895_06050 [Pseudomonas sp. FW305-3-2-15-E-TSA4]POA44617.1 hypothetical protein C1894_04630 [Pseudomonas sp. FW305-3-2-15-E-TSA2]